MATAYENLLSNAASNNMLGVDGMLRQNEYWRRYLQNQGISPEAIGAIGIGASLSDGDFEAPAQTRQPDEFWDYYDYWKDDGISGRNLAQVGGFLTGAPITQLTDYGMGQNPAGDIGSWIGSGLLGRQAGSLEEAIALSNIGAVGGEILGKEVAGQLGYTGQWFDINQPGSSMAKALGFEAGTKGFDKIVNITQDYIAEKEEEGLSRDEIKDEIVNFGDATILEQTTPVIEDRSLMPGERMATDYRGTISPVEAFEAATKEPESVSDFAGMFTGIADTVGSWFGGAQDAVTSYVGSDDSMPDYSGLTETGQIDWTRYGDTDEGEEEAQSGFNDSSHNWN